MIYFTDIAGNAYFPDLHTVCATRDGLFVMLPGGDERAVVMHWE